MNIDYLGRRAGAGIRIDADDAAEQLPDAHELVRRRSPSSSVA